MTAVFSTRDDLVAKHQAYLDMTTIKPPPPADTKFVKAVSCELNPGVLNDDGSPQPSPNFIFVDDCLLAAIGSRICQLLVACIEAISVVLGRPVTSVRQCSLAINKWQGMVVGHRIVLIGLVFDSRALTVGLTREYLSNVLGIIETSWTGRSTFTLEAILKLAGKLARLGEGAPWVYHLMTHIYSSIAYALREHESLLGESSSFIKLVNKLKSKILHTTNNVLFLRTFST